MKLIISIPIYSLYFVCKYFEVIDEVIKNEEVKGLLVENVLLPQLSKSRALYHFFFLSRRLLIVMIVVSMINFPIL